MAKRMTTAEWVQRARAVHGERYGYEDVVYVGKSEDVIIRCPEHGQFNQRAGNHIRLGNGCPTCARQRSRMPPKAKQLPTAEELLAAFEYDPISGRLTNRVSRARAGKGQDAGVINEVGYVQITLNRVKFLAHRIIMIMCGLEIPDKYEVDHVNGDRADNRFCNLRVVEKSANTKNKRMRSDNTSGVTGVGKTPAGFTAHINHQGKAVYLGLFKTIEEASLARENAKKIYGYHPNHGKSYEERTAYERGEE